MDDLKKQADELGIAIDGRWSERRIQEEIDKVLASGPEKEKEDPVAEEKLFPVKLIRNYRPISEKFEVIDSEGARAPTDEELAKVPSGTVIALPIPEAQSVINKKIAERNDPIA